MLTQETSQNRERENDFVNSAKLAPDTRAYVRVSAEKSCRNLAANPVGLVSRQTGICVAQRLARGAIPSNANSHNLFIVPYTKCNIIPK